MKEPTEIGAYEARVHFSKLLDRVARGERLIITRNGERVAELLPHQLERSTLVAQRMTAISEIKKMQKQIAFTDHDDLMKEKHKGHKW